MDSLQQPKTIHQGIPKTDSEIYILTISVRDKKLNPTMLSYATTRLFLNSSRLWCAATRLFPTGFRQVVNLLSFGAYVTDLHLGEVDVSNIDKVKNYKGNPVLTPDKSNGLKQKSEVLIFHLRSIPKDRLLEKVGDVEKSTIAAAIKTLNDLLTY